MKEFDNTPVPYLAVALNLRAHSNLLPGMVYLVYWSEHERSPCSRTQYDPARQIICSRQLIISIKINVVLRSWR
jgi:hypothetical protein